jgi:Zn-dependent protease with chaperone function
MRASHTVNVVRWFLAAALISNGLSAHAQAPTVEPRPADAQATRVAVPEPSELALEYYHSGNALWLVDQAWGIFLPCLFLFTGVSAGIAGWSRRLGRYWYFGIALFFLSYSALGYLLTFPLTYYQGFERPHAYGLSDQALGKWLADSLKGWAVSAVIGLLFLWVPYGLLARSPRRWWLYTALLAVPFLVLYILVTPIWIDPLFNRFGPMQDKALEAEILALADEAGIEGGRVYEVEKSADTKTVNAYVTGLFGTKRIVLWDTLIAQFPEREVLFVMGHEMGHYALDHVWKGIAFFSVLILLGLWLVERLALWLLAHYRHRFGFENLADVASLPLLALCVHVVVLVLSPIGLAFSRHLEHEADRFGLEITQDNEAAARAFVRMQHTNLAVPRPGWLFVLWRASHPTLGERVDFANDYRPWQTGDPLRYSDLFRARSGPARRVTSPKIDRDRRRYGWFSATTTS